MAGFLLRRTFRAVLLVIVVSSTALILVHAAPGDAIDDLGANASFVKAERARLGLDRPLIEQYTNWVRGALTLDLGQSTRYQRPVSALLAERVPGTLMLGITALVLAIGAGIPLGVAGGAQPDRWWARAISAVSMLLVSVPPLITSLVLLLIAARTGWLPAGGLNVPSDAGTLSRIVITARSLILPALAL